MNRVGTLATVWLGLSVRCAQCHDHKFDPIPHRDYYSLFAILDTVEDIDIDAPIGKTIETHRTVVANYSQELAALFHEHGYHSKQTAYEEVMKQVSADPESLYPSHDYKRWLLLNARVSNAERILQTPSVDQTMQERDAFLDFFLEKQFKLVDLQKAVDELRQRYPTRISASVVRERPTPLPTRLRIRGDFYQPAEIVEPATLSALHSHQPFIGKWHSETRSDDTGRLDC